MGKINFTPKQQIIFDEFKNSDFLKQNFYFTGGTALSAIYLNHRLSEDLDFFSQNKFDTLPILNLMTEWSKKHKFTVELQEREVVRIFLLQFADGEKLKVDFGYYPYQRLEEGTNLQGVFIDSLLDIGANKVMTIMQRTDIKDYVDLYFLLKQHTFWDLLNHSQHKFRLEIDVILLASNFLRINQFDYMPKMLVTLKLEDLQVFYKDLAKKIGLSVVEK